MWNQFWNLDVELGCRTWMWMTSTKLFKGTHKKKFEVQ